MERKEYLGGGGGRRSSLDVTERIPVYVIQ